MKKTIEKADAPFRPNAAAASRLKRFKTITVVLLALAIGCVALSLWARQRQNLVQGPWGLAVLPGGQIWLSVDDELWRLDADGRRQQQVSIAEAGLPGAAGVLMPHPDGYLVAWSRHSPTLHLLTAGDARPVANLTPQWPRDLARHGDEAISYAFAPDGRVAIATGGGHTVALFDAQGRYLARSPADTFHFTNGLWWADGGWWCTDTNRPALVRLDDTHLTETQRVALNEPQEDWRFLDLAAASRGEAADGQKPLGVVARLANGMERGHVVDVWPDGTQRAYPVPESESALEPRAMAWLGDTLLVVDGQDFSIRRYSADRQPMADWGDATVRADLAQRRALLEHWRNVYLTSLAGAIVLFLLGLAVVWWTQRLETRAKLAQIAPELAAQANGELSVVGTRVPVSVWPPASVANGELSVVGTPVLSNSQLAWRRFRAIWPLFLVFLVSPVIAVILSQAQNILLKSSSLIGNRSIAVQLLCLWGIAMLAAVSLGAWASQRLTHAWQNDESFANANALQKLKRSDLFWPLRQPNEQPHETLMLGTNRWLVLTNQRLLVFRSSGFDASLQVSVPRGAIRSAQFTPLEQVPWQQRWRGWMVFGQWYLSLALADGSTIAGAVVCPQAAQRMAALIHQIPPAFAVPEVVAKDVPQETPPTGRGTFWPQETPPLRRGTFWQTLASLLIPGLGQWMQGRFGIGLLFFVPWLAVMGVFAFIAWAAWMPIAEVPPHIHIIWQAGQIGLMALAINLTAAYVAWRLPGVPSA